MHKPYNLNVSFKIVSKKNTFDLQAIVSALAVNCPRDPQAFILEKLKLIINYEEVLDDLRWYVFYCIFGYRVLSD